MHLNNYEIMLLLYFETMDADLRLIPVNLVHLLEPKTFQTDSGPVFGHIRVLKPNLSQSEPRAMPRRMPYVYTFRNGEGGDLMKTFLSLMAAALFAVCALVLASCGKTYGTEPAAGSAANPEGGQTRAPATTTDSPSPLRVTVFDVGKGDCILLQSDSDSVLIDTGYESTADDVISYLRAHGVDHLDAMIITHYDRDHVDGMRPIGEAVDVKTIYLPGYDGADKNYRSCISSTESLGVPTQRVTKELALHIGNARLAVFPSGVKYIPGSGKTEGNDNDMSLVASLVNGRDSYLFAGDLEEDGISAYLAANHGRFDVLKMPHHGRHSPNSSEFLDDVQPRIAVITDAKKEPADKKTLKLLKSADVETYRSSSDGTVVIESDGSGTYSVSAG